MSKLNPLTDDLQSPKESLDDFAALSLRVLKHIPNVVTDREETDEYIIFSSEAAGSKKYVRPIKKKLFIFNPKKFSEKYKALKSILKMLRKGRKISDFKLCFTIDSTIYTILQSIGAGLDLLANPNSARKHVGNRFEEFVRLLITEIGIANKKVVLKIPYKSRNTNEIYSCETDLIFSPHKKVHSDSTNIALDEVVVSLKTTSKDRMGKIFTDKLLLEKFVNHEVKVVGIFVNDVQRKKHNKVNYTLVSGLFMVYTQILTKLEGVYYLDLPPKAKEAPFNEHIFSFSKFLCEDIWRLIGRNS